MKNGQCVESVCYVMCKRERGTYTSLLHETRDRGKMSCLGQRFT